MLTVAVLDRYISSKQKGTGDALSFIEELDQKISNLHNHPLLLSALIKQRYILPGKHQNSLQQDTLYTKQKVAVTFRVSVRTVDNWIQRGLEITSIGGAIA